MTQTKEYIQEVLLNFADFIKKEYPLTKFLKIHYLNITEEHPTSQELVDKFTKIFYH